MIERMNEQYNLWIPDPEKIGDLNITDIPEYQNSVHTLIAILVDNPTYNEDGTINRKALLLERGVLKKGSSMTRGEYRDIQFNPDTSRYKLLPKKNFRKK
jgi:hypothetical protein